MITLISGKITWRALTYLKLRVQSHLLNSVAAILTAVACIAEA